MTVNEKRALSSLAALIAFKATLITSIILTDRHYRRKMARQPA